MELGCDWGEERGNSFGILETGPVGFWLLNGKHCEVMEKSFCVWIKGDMLIEQAQITKKSTKEIPQVLTSGDKQF